MKKESFKILLAGGGTGGHISPAIAVAQELNRNEHQPLIITLEKNRNYPPFKLISKEIPVVYYKAPLIPKNPGMLILFFKDLFYSWKILNSIKKERKPDAVIAFGGYPVFPAVKWAVMNRIPVFLHEQNSKPGLITRLFRPFSKNVFHSFPQVNYKKNEVITGNPLRDSFLSFKNQKTNSTQKIKIKSILITGGSQGASDLNSLYLNLVKNPFFKNIKFTLSTGEKNFSDVKSKSRSIDNVYPFINDMPGELYKHDLIFCRSGSGSVYESVWSQKPVIYFPYPYATGNHQTLNAQSICSNSENIYYNLIDERPFNVEKVTENIIEIIKKIEKQSGGVRSEDIILPLDGHQKIFKFVIDFLENNS